MRKIRSFFNIFIILVILLSTYLMVTKYSRDLEKTKFLLGIKRVYEIEKVLGQPTYMFSSQGQFGKCLMSINDFEEGITIQVYLINKTPPRFLVVKVSQNKETVLASIIEHS